MIIPPRRLSAGHEVGLMKLCRISAVEITRAVRRHEIRIGDTSLLRDTYIERAICRKSADERSFIPARERTSRETEKERERNKTSNLSLQDETFELSRR